MEKVGLKLNIQKTKIMASGPITSWQIDGETAADFILGGSKVTADAETLIPWKKSYDQSRQHIRRRQWQPTPVLLPGKSHGRRSLVAFSPWGREESDMTERLHFFHFHALEKEMATHSSVLAWRIPGTAEPGGLPSMGSHRVGHD